MELQELAREAYGYFITKKRADDTSYICTKDETPDWVREMVFEAHGDKLPDDYVYDWIDYKFEWIKNFHAACPGE